MTPESCYGRLVNLREQLVEIPKQHNSPSSNLTFTPTQYCEIVDDLDDIIRCIQRGMKDEQTRWYEAALEPDSEDMEAR